MQHDIQINRDLLVLLTSDVTCQLDRTEIPRMFGSFWSRSDWKNFYQSRNTGTCNALFEGVCDQSCFVLAFPDVEALHPRRGPGRSVHTQPYTDMRRVARGHFGCNLETANIAFATTKLFRYSRGQKLRCIMPFKYNCPAHRNFCPRPYLQYNASERFENNSMDRHGNLVKSSAKIVFAIFLELTFHILIQYMMQSTVRALAG